MDFTCPLQIKPEIPTASGILPAIPAKASLVNTDTGSSDILS